MCYPTEAAPTFALWSVKGGRREQMSGTKPFLRWIGGKARLVHLLRQCVPPLPDDSTYYEPFVGAASLFFSLRPKKAVLGDLNEELVDCYNWVKKDPSIVWEHLKSWLNVRGPESYYQARKNFNKAQSSYERAALFIYLNKTCYNGGWRVNRNGQFNVPYGGKDKPAFPNPGFDVRS